MLCPADLHPCSHYVLLAVVVAVLLPLLGVGRRLSYSQLVQLVALSQVACYGLLVCPSMGRPYVFDRSYVVLPEVYTAIG